MNQITARPNVSSKSLPGPHDITRTQLDNGITLLTRPNFNSPSVVVSGYLACGSLFDPPDKLGLAQFTAMSLTRGTAGRNFQEIFEALESAGASLGFGASVHNTSFGGRALTEDLPLILGLLAESVQQPAFPKDQVERLRTQFLTSLAMRAQDTDEMSSLAFDAAMFPNHPYGRPEDGYPETVQAIQVEDLASFHRQHYGPRGMVIVVVGAVSAQQALDEVNKALGSWKNPLQGESPSVPPAFAPEKTFQQHIAIPGKSQTDLVMGTLGPLRKSPDFLPASLGNNILGQFGMMGRIGDVVRERAGLAYHASTSLNAWIGAGTWEVSAGVNPANLQRAIDLIRRELERYVKRSVYKRELKDSQANFIGRLPLSLESNNGVANALLNLERFQLGLDYYMRYPQAVLEVTPEQILAVSQKYIDPERLIITSAGPEI